MPIGRVGAPLCESATFEVVDQRDDGAAVDTQRLLVQRLLGLAFVCSELVEHAVVAWVEVERGEPLSEAPMPVGAQLRSRNPARRLNVAPGPPSCESDRDRLQLRALPAEMYGGRQSAGR